MFQDTWVKSLEKRDKYDQNFAFEPWLMSLCINLYRDHYRRNRLTNKFFQVFGQTEVKDFVIESVRDPQNTLEELLVKEEVSKDLRKELNRLEDKYRLPLILFYYNEYSYLQIAQVLNIKEGTVKSRISTAKAKLKERMMAYER